MDSLRFPKSSTSSGGKSPSSGVGIPIGIKFNAGEEIIEDILKPPSENQNQSLSNSPMQNVEDFNWRKEILQGGFFNRKRSSSIEGNKSGGILANSISTSVISSTNTTNQSNILSAGDGALGSSLSSNLSNTDNSSVGTWKLIKGKVSQAMEDIKSSKTAQSQIQPKEISNEDSDGGETPYFTSVTSNSDNISSIDLGSLNAALPIGYNLSTLKTQHKYFGFSRRSNKSDTDSDDENEMPSVVEDLIESSSLRKSFANLKSKAKTHLAGSSTASTSSGKNLILTTSENSETKTSTTAVTASVVTSNLTSIPSSSTTSSLSLSSGIRSTFLRKRTKKQPSDKISPLSTTVSATILFEQQQQSTAKKTKKEFDIESGVEMFEDMEILNVTNNDRTFNDDISNMDLISDSSPQQEGLRMSLSTDTITFKKPNLNVLQHQKTVPNLLLTNKQDQDKKKIDPLIISTTTNEKNINKKLIEFNKDKITTAKHFIVLIQTMILKILINSNFIMTGILFMILIIAPIAEFFRGIVACLCIITFFNTFSEYFWNFLNEKIENINVSYFSDGLNNTSNLNNMIGPQRCKFEIPDYSKMSICEIPPIEEHKSLKVYSGWMNEINNYDPNNFHQSMTRTVYIRLDGSVLRILNTSTRITKRSMWNENPIDRKNIIFTCSRTFYLLGARVEMLPRGLARKRYFSRKYPLQLIIKNSEHQKSFPGPDESINLSTIDNNSAFNGNDNFKMLDKNDNSINRTFTEESQDVSNKICSNSLPSENNRNVIHQNSNESNEELRNNISSDNQNNDLDFGSLINDLDLLLNSDLQNLQDTQDPIALKETLPCGDETRILLFARCDREKEDWYRRFYSASIGAIHDQDLKIPDIVMIPDEEISHAFKATNSVEQLNENYNQNNELFKNNSNEKDNKDQLPIQYNGNNLTSVTNTSNSNNEKINSVPIEEAFTFEGLLFSADSARNSPEYIKFMARYQKACTQNKIPVVKSSLVPNETPTKRNRRQKRQEDELWKGINQSLYLGPSGSIVWANVLIGRILFSCLNDSILLEKIQNFLQRKLSAIRLPSFMEDVSIANINLGDTPPLIHRISQPLLDERGTWIDADVTYEGLIHMTITTKLNLLRLKRSQHSGGINSTSHHHNSSGNQATSTSTTNNSSRPSSAFGERNQATDRSNPNNTSNAGGSTSSTVGGNGNLIASGNLTGGSNICSNSNSSQIVSCTNSLTENDKSSPTIANSDNVNENENSSFISNLINTNINSDCNSQNCLTANSAIYDSNAESSGASSSESESPTNGSAFDVSSESQSFHPSPGSSRRFLRIVDRITASNIFQSATEISYIQRAMENMSTKITLRVELKGLVSRVVFNIPPPPSDRVWLAFRGPPRLWISAKPAVGDHTFDWGVVTNVIENKLCDEVYKYLVYPNMVDIIVPFLGQSTYRE